MGNPFVSRVGGVLSADIAVPEHERELRFYASVLGTGAEPLWREDLMNNLGMPVIGLGARTPEHADLPLQWMPHILVADVAGTVERAVALGGSELMHGKDDAGGSQWAVLRDPDGAAFGIIPVVPAEALPTLEAGVRVGHVAGIRLAVPDAARSRDFYGEVIGWPAQDAARIHSADGGEASVPAVWLLELPVGDLDESLRRVREGGGEVLLAERSAGDACIYAVIRDPVGACLALVPG